MIAKVWRLGWSRLLWCSCAPRSISPETAGGFALRRSRNCHVSEDLLRESMSSPYRQNVMHSRSSQWGSSGRLAEDTLTSLVYSSDDCLWVPGCVSSRHM